MGLATLTQLPSSRHHSSSSPFGPLSHPHARSRTTRRTQPHLSITTSRPVHPHHPLQSPQTSRAPRSSHPLTSPTPSLDSSSPSSSPFIGTTHALSPSSASSPQRRTFRLSALVDIMSAASTQYNNQVAALQSPSSNPPTTMSATTRSSNSPPVTTSLRDVILRQQANSLPSPAASSQPLSARSPMSATAPASANGVIVGYNQRQFGPLVVPSPTNLVPPPSISFDSATPTHARPVAPSMRHTSSQSNIHPQFGAKPVCAISCRSCTTPLCYRGMRALLLGNKRIELFSTDSQPVGVSLVCWPDYTTQNCQCKIRDNACIGCGSVVGYHVTTPCETCLEACHNGHYWMFHSEGVTYTERLTGSGKGPLRWANLAAPNDDHGDSGMLSEGVGR
ncbi:hypothetical protein SeLEV6574_g03690 [Synchytrium endobioticum]|uniref:Protein FAM72 n=1 Tax=Synchytrium endobioticum TaxID=286115 RepID=A0A507D331_9FUNG|nr:hypothetical protein SeLEV6574_g03690 [Synchytrium endobioticum]